jgi:hypothetical protein
VTFQPSYTWAAFHISGLRSPYLPGIAQHPSDTAHMADRDGHHRCHACPPSTNPVTGGRYERVSTVEVPNGNKTRDLLQVTREISRNRLRSARQRPAEDALPAWLLSMLFRSGIIGSWQAPYVMAGLMNPITARTKDDGCEGDWDTNTPTE